MLCFSLLNLQLEEVLILSQLLHLLVQLSNSILKVAIRLSLYIHIHKVRKII